MAFPTIRHSDKCNKGLMAAGARGADADCYGCIAWLDWDKSEDGQRWK